MIDTIKGTITYLTAAIALLGAMIMAYLAWTQPIPDGGGRDIAILYGLLGLIVGSVLTFLFGGEVATRATRAAQASTAVGANAATGVVPAATNVPFSGMPAATNVPTYTVTSDPPPTGNS